MSCIDFTRELGRAEGRIELKVKRKTFFYDVTSEIFPGEGKLIKLHIATSD